MVRDDDGNIAVSEPQRVTVQPGQIQAPVLLGPFPRKAAAIVTEIDENDGSIIGIKIVDPGSDYRVPPTIEFVGGNPSTPASFTAKILGGVISKIDVASPGSGYDPSVTLEIVDGKFAGARQPEHVAKLKPDFNADGGIERIEIESGGAYYDPPSGKVKVVVHYNGTFAGHGFEAGPIHTVNGVISEFVPIVCFQ